MAVSRTPLLATVAGLATAGLLFGAGAAAAQPHGGLLDSTCTFGQFQAAAQQHAPDLAANPERMAKFEKVLNLSVEERHAKAAEKREKKGEISPEKREKIREWKESPEGQANIAAMRTVLDTCNQY
ncbi:hypothetical protein [Mycolicibacterium thermoresistibile]